MRIISLNVNGLRSAARKGLAEWLAALPRWDVLCVQELKAQEADLAPELQELGRARGHFHYAQRKGYSGVALFCKKRPARVSMGFGVPEFDAEGRYVRADFPEFSVISVYFPSGSSSPERQAAKFRFLAAFFPHLAALRREGREIVVCGDWNIAHRAIDLRNWRSNQKNSGFLPEERAWIGQVFEELGWVDVYRHLHPEATGEAYTWWSNRGAAWEKNVGWRIDYQVATPGLAARAKQAEVYKASRFSDHAPLIVDYRK
ncbi:MAG: exodeoxyribonuclease III [Burkholderiales bacterium]|nr:MAG: exodeoxyribonuclease III [Burkholderiales bacterium]